MSIFAAHIANCDILPPQNELRLRIFVLSVLSDPCYPYIRNSDLVSGNCGVDLGDIVVYCQYILYRDPAVFGGHSYRIAIALENDFAVDTLLDELFPFVPIRKAVRFIDNRFILYFTGALPAFAVQADHSEFAIILAFELFVIRIEQNNIRTVPDKTRSGQAHRVE